VFALVGAVLASISCGTDDDPCEPAAETPIANPVVVIETSLGDIGLVLYPLDAPITVGNFLRYLREDFYDSLTVHRVIRTFVIQGGGFDKDMELKPPHEPVPNEANNGLKNIRGSIAMARTTDPHSATSQFFINVTDNTFLNFRDETPQGWGYCVFGRVIEGMDVVDLIENVPTTTRNGYNDVPVDPVVILGVTRRQ
jgi:cyclophilin family peptidyl-prolyl cis-trans isomerase